MGRATAPLGPEEAKLKMLRIVSWVVLGCPRLRPWVICMEYHRRTALGVQKGKKTAEGRLPCGPATPEMVVRPFQEWPARRRYKGKP
jgi:hypothetical protein